MPAGAHCPLPCGRLRGSDAAAAGRRGCLSAFDPVRTEDAIEIAGLSPILDEGGEPPYLDLSLTCNGKAYRAAILAAEGEWAVRVQDELGRSCTEEADLYATQSDAILVALLIALDHSRSAE